MGFLDVLKSILGKDSLVKIDARTTDNRRIELHAQTVIIGNQTINDPDSVKKIFEAIKNANQQETLPFQIVHKDLLPDFIDYEEINLKDREWLHSIKSALSANDVECIMMARRAFLAYRDGKKEKGICIAL
ncbi:MAG: hypothetical protein AABX47_08255 [Nanoarchaeota archaeon]